MIIGENRSFDHVFATYQPRHGQTVWNLLSEGIVNADGTPGPNFSKAQQNASIDQASDGYHLMKSAQAFLPKPGFAGIRSPEAPEDSYVPGDSLSMAQQSENGLPSDYYQYLISGGTGLASQTPDTRIANVNSLPPGPFQLTNSSGFGYNAYAASPVHRFFQMWQELDCSVDHATYENPSGCNADLFPWVETTVGAGGNGAAVPANFSIEWSPSSMTTGEGSTSMGFYNVQNGDVPYFKILADNYAMSDNFHQSVNGGTGANHIMLGHGDLIWFSDGKGNSRCTAAQCRSGCGNAQRRHRGWKSKTPILRRAPTTGIPRDWIRRRFLWVSLFWRGELHESLLPDMTQPGVAQIVNYLQSLSHPIMPNCDPGHYYLLNNYNPGYFGDGSNAYTDTNPNNTVFTIPPSSLRSIGDVLLAANVSWKYYGDQWNNYLTDPYQLNYSAVGGTTDEYCNICNPFQPDTSIMTNAAVRTAHLKDTTDLYSDIQYGTLPAVSFVKPSGLVDGHPSSLQTESLRRLLEKDRGRRSGEPVALGRHCDLDHL